MACPRGMFLIMAVMQMDCDVDSEKAREPFDAFIEKTYPNLMQSALDTDGQPHTTSSIELFPEKP